MSPSTTPIEACCGRWPAVGSGAFSNAELYQQVRLERERLSSITLNIGEGVCAIAADGKLTFVNRAAANMIELPSVNITIDDPVSDGALMAPDFLLRALAREAMRTGRTIREDDARFRRKNGGTIPVAYTVSAVMSGGAPSGAVIAFRDITERKAFEDELHHHACYDSLTGLPNRRLLVERLDQALRRSALDRKTHALIFVDVDRFKSVNDSLGHVTGDEFLVAIGTRMLGTVRSHDLLARVGGDEFVVLLEDVAGIGEAVAAARRICAAVEDPIVLPGGYESSPASRSGSPSQSQARRPTTCFVTPTSQCTTPRPKRAAALTRSSTRPPWESVPRRAFRSRLICARGWSGTNSKCTTSRSTLSTSSA